VVFITFKVDEMRIDQGAFYVSVTKQVHYMQYVFGFLIFHCGFPMSQRVKVYLHDSWVRKLVGNFLSCGAELVFHVIIDRHSKARAEGASADQLLPEL
jgi:hypothetical protein